MRTIKRGLLIATCLLLVLPAAPALAKKKHKKKPVKLGPVVTVTATGNTVSTPLADSHAVATCPHGKQVVGGGFSAPLGGSNAILVHNSYRSSAQSWTADGLYLGGTPGAATATAYCRNTTKKPVSDVAQTQSFSSPLETHSLSPTCPVGTQLVGGGFQATFNSSFFLVEQNAPGPGAGAWSVTGVDTVAASQTLTAHAYCLAGIRAPVILSQSTSASFAGGASLSATTGACPTPPKPKKGKKKHKKKFPQLLSAGGFGGPVYSGSGPAPIWADSMVVGAGWRATAFNAGSSSGNSTITSYGVCV